MNVSELRIGNYVQLAIVQEPIVITSILKHTDFPKSGECPQYEPIPFSENWRLRFQDIDFDSESMEINLVSIDTANEYNFSEEKNPSAFKYLLFINGGLGDKESYGARVEIKYVHQLQNIYFALTGSELPFA